MVVLIDNYDSFSYNLVQMAGSITKDIRVIRNDEMTVEEIRKLQPDHIILSPGPGYPKDAGVCEEVVRRLQGEIPILGVCLGHQAICEVYGCTIGHASRLMHGKQSRIRVKTDNPLFQGMDETILGARYHSLSAHRDSIPEELEVIADSEDNEVMAVRHQTYPVYGVQFHPESILTPEGRKILENFFQTTPYR